MSPIEIVEPKVEWARQFAAIAADLRAAFAELALRIDHIGSTSVPGLPAKDRIDIQVAVASLEPMDRILGAFAIADLDLFRGGIAHDHRPAGASGPESDWQKVLGFASAGTGLDGRPRSSRHVHVRVDGSPNARYALLFRDYLRADSRAAATYAMIKRALAEHAPEDVEFYYEVKDPVCDLIMLAAEAWATRTGWAPGPPDA
jgi:GrpB-like predicted nucleotidyltransferase (UPF0157 family)